MTNVVEIYKRVGDVELAAHVHSPSLAGEGRVGVVFFHGGGFRFGTPLQLAPHCSRLAERGHVAVTMQYRLCEANAANAADLVADAKSAIRWMRANAQRFGVHPNRVVAGGASAGGHLAACTALVEGFDSPGDDMDVSCVPDALAMFNPVLDVLALPHDGVSQKIHEVFGADEEALSPMQHVRSGMPPSVLFQGTDDVLTPLEDARRFRDAMAACGNTVLLHEYAGQAHGFFNAGVDDNKWFEDTMARLERFIDSLWSGNELSAALSTRRRRASS